MIALMWLPMVAMAQNDWEIPDQATPTKTEVVKPNPNEKYLTGAVPVKNGKVVFEQTFYAPGKSAEEESPIRRRIRVFRRQRLSD